MINLTPSLQTYVKRSNNTDRQNSETTHPKVSLIIIIIVAIANPHPELPHLLHTNLLPPRHLPRLKHHQVRIRALFQRPLHPLQPQHRRRRRRHTPHNLCETRPAPLPEILQTLPQRRAAARQRVGAFARQPRALLLPAVAVRPVVEPVGQA